MARRTVSTALGTAGLCALAAFLSVGGLTAQQSGNGWQPFLGCWQPDTGEEAESLLCFVPSGSQVEMLTVADGQIEYREFFEADGVPRAVNQNGCEGTESARFSSDRDRIFTSSDMTCDDQVTRSTGIISMSGPDAWVDVRTLVGEDGQPSAWVQWYGRADADVLTGLGFENPVRQGPLAARAVQSVDALSVDDVIEASEAVGEEALKAWLAESGMGVDRLNADDLIALDDAGVDGEIIDVLVAVSYPERFAVGNADGYDDEYRPRRRAGRPIWAGPMYGYGYGGYYSSFYGFRRGLGYGYYGGYPYWGYGYRPVQVIVDRIDRGGGRVINGQGYRRSGDRASTGTAVPRGGSPRIDRSVAPSSGRSRPAATRSRPVTRSQPPATSRPPRKAKRRPGGF